MYINIPFSGLVVIMFGDPAQLLPVAANSLQVDICKDNDLLGFSLYHQFLKSITKD